MRWRTQIRSTGDRADNMEERISKLEDSNLEMIQVEEEREIRFLKGRNPERVIWLFQEGQH